MKCTAFTTDKFGAERSHQGQKRINRELMHHTQSQHGGDPVHSDASAPSQETVLKNGCSPSGVLLV